MSVEHKVTDEALMQAYQEGDLAAFNVLYDRYSTKVYAYLSKRVFEKFERDDLFQSVFLKLHKSRELYDPKFPFAPWLFTICRTSFLDYLKLSKSRTCFEEIKDQGHEASKADLSMSVFEAIKELSEEQQNLLKLRYGDGLDFSQIARRLKTSPANVRQLTSRALRKFRGKL